MKPIFLLSLFLFGTLVPGQAQEEVTRIPVLWKHYQEHKTETPGTTFLQYLELHYGNGFAKHNAAHDHTNLPMKSGDHHLHPPLPVDLPELVFIYFHQSFDIDQTPVFLDQSYTYLLLCDIWQPPRNC